MPSKYDDKYVLCPYYHTNDKCKIKCDGIEETISTHPIFKSDAQKKQYMKKYCCGDFKDCRYANMLEMMWEEKLEEGKA